MDRCTGLRDIPGIPLKMAFNPFPNKPWFLRVYSIIHLKTLCEKEKLLVTSNFSFSHSVFYRYREFSTIFINNENVVCKLSKFEKLSFGKGLKPYNQSTRDALKFRSYHLIVWKILSR